MLNTIVGKKVLLILFILGLIIGGGYIFCGYIMDLILYKSLSGAFDPKVSEDDIKYAKEILSQIESVTIYDTSAYERKQVNGEIVATLRDLEEVKNSDIPYEVLDFETIKKMFHEAQYRPEFVLWKGEYLGIAKLTNGNEKIIRISFYGNFYAIEGIKGFYEFEGEQVSED